MAFVKWLKETKQQNWEINHQVLFGLSWYFQIKKVQFKPAFVWPLQWCNLKSIIIFKTVTFKFQFHLATHGLPSPAHFQISFRRNRKYHNKNSKTVTTLTSHICYILTSWLIIWASLLHWFFIGKTSNSEVEASCTGWQLNVI